MNKSTLEHRLKDMIGKTFIYGGNIHYVKNASVNHHRELAILETHLSTFERRFDSAQEFLKMWQPVKAMSPSAVPAVVPANEIVTSTNTTSDDVIASLKAMAQKVQDDPKYIPQAQALVNCSNAIMNVVRTKLDVLKHANTKEK